MAATKAAWAKAERDYGNPDVTVASIAERLGLSSMAVISKMRALGIARGKHKPAGKIKAKRSSSRKPSAKTVAADPKSTPEKTPAKVTTASVSKPAADGTADPEAKKPSVHKPIALVQRVYDTIDKELAKLENQDGTTSQDRERGSRALSQLVNSLEKAAEMQRDIIKDKSRGSGVKDKEALAHAEDLRRKIAERLEKLFVKRRTTKPAGGAE